MHIIVFFDNNADWTPEQFLLYAVYRSLVHRQCTNHVWSDEQRRDRARREAPLPPADRLQDPGQHKAANAGLWVL